MKCAVPGSAKYNFEATEVRELFEDLNFGLLTMRTSFVYRFCSTCHLCNIREIDLLMPEGVNSKQGFLKCLVGISPIPGNQSNQMPTDVYRDLWDLCCMPGSLSEIDFKQIRIIKGQGLDLCVLLTTSNTLQLALPAFLCPPVPWFMWCNGA
jgi:hypothetical protein